MDAREIESLSMLSRGFAELKEANPELAYNVVLDIISGINEYAHRRDLSLSVRLTSRRLLPAAPLCDNMCKLPVVCSLIRGSSARVR